MTQEEKKNRLEKLRTMVSSYVPQKALSEDNQDENFVSLITVEQVLRKYQNELYKKIEEYETHISSLLRKKCKIVFPNSSSTPYRAFQKGEDDLAISLPSTTFTDENRVRLTINGEEKGIFTHQYWSSVHKQYKYDETHYQRLLKNDSKTSEFISYYLDWVKKFNNVNGIMTNIGLLLDVFQNPRDGLQVVISDRSKEENGLNSSEQKSFNLARFLFYKEHLTANFYFLKDVDSNEKNLHYNNNECKDILNETQIIDIYSNIKVDISLFSKEIQEEMKQNENYRNLGLQGRTDLDKSEQKRAQQERLMVAYKNLKESVEALNNVQMEIEFEKIKVIGLEAIFFKNSGKPNEAGFIEIDEKFKNNMLLRMLDLSNLDLTNVDIRNIDFSGTNIHINPQKIYNKDMTNVNATGLKFSPFQDSFDDVILDGAVITDWEAAINLSKLRSYNNQTVIPDSCKNKESSNSNTIKM